MRLSIFETFSFFRLQVQSDRQVSSCRQVGFQSNRHSLKKTRKHYKCDEITAEVKDKEQDDTTFHRK
jgi:hypothetical protein